MIPDKLTPNNITTMLDAIAKLRDLHRSFSKNPFEYVDHATRDEHRDLSQIFARLLDMVRLTLNEAQSRFRAGDVEFVCDPGIVEIRNQLSHRAEGQSVTARFLAKMMRRGELPENDVGGAEGQKEKEADSPAGGEHAERSGRSPGDGVGV